MQPLFKTIDDVWNGIFTLVFLGLFGMLVVWLDQNGWIPDRIKPFDFILLSLATFRMVRLVTYDKISLFVRKHFETVDRPFHHAVSELLICPWCSGIWSALLVVALFTVFPFGWLFVLLLAAAGLGSFLQIVANNVVHRSEKAMVEKRLLERDEEGIMK